MATTTRWNKSLEENGLTDLFNSAGDTAAQFGEIFGNIITGLGEFFKAVTGPGSGGQIMLDFLKGITGQFAAMDGEARGAGSVSQFFTDLSANAVPVLNFLGDIIDVFMQIGANPNIGKAFEALTSDDNKANWEAIFQSFADAAPSLFDLVVVIGEILAGFADSEAPKAFFDTIRQLITPLAEWISDPQNKAIVDTIGKIFATLSAIGFVIGTVKFAFKVFLGNIIFGLTTIGSFFGGVGSIFKKVSGFLKIAGGGIANFIKVAVANFKILFPVVKIWGYIIGQTILLAFKAVGGAIFGLIKFMGIALDKFIPIVLKFGAFIITTVGRIVLAIGRIFLGILGPWGIAIAAIIAGLTFFFTQTELGKKIWEGFISFLSDSLKNIGDFFTTLWTNVTDGWTKMVDAFKDVNLGTVFKNIVNGAITVFEGFINNIVGGINNGIIKAINSISVDIPQWVRDGAALLNYTLPSKVGFNLSPIGSVSIPRLAEGGVVMPRPGGTFANIAEAGRPERVEPLDPSGLSRRDRALIQQMSRGSGMNINVYPSAGMDERELADMVSRKIALEIRRGTI